MYTSEGILNTGVQAGIGADIYFAPRFLGLGLRTGIYGAYYFYDGKAGHESAVSTREVAVKIPVQGIYRFDFNKTVGIYASCGLVADIGVYASGVENPYNNPDTPYFRRFNYGLMYGVGVQVRNFVVDVSLVNGLQNLSHDERYEILRNSTIQLRLGFSFGKPDNNR